MATSSIFESVKITDPNKAKAFWDAMEASIEDREKELPREAPSYVMADAGMIQQIQAKRRSHR